MLNLTVARTLHVQYFWRHDTSLERSFGPCCCDSSFQLSLHWLRFCYLDKVWLHPSTLLSRAARRWFGHSFLSSRETYVASVLLAVRQVTLVM